MTKEYSSLILLTILILTAACSKSPEKDHVASIKAPIFQNMGSHTYKVTTKSELAQKYFNQGLNLSYGFNHAEAGRSFKQASKIDKNCAMCYWGAAYVLGPNINVPMEQTSASEAYTLIQKAIKVSNKANEKEKNLISALSKRYTTEAVSDRSAFDLEYANAMRELAKKYADDADILSLFAESLMNLHPWNYWRSDGKPHPWTPEILEALEKALK